MDTFREENVGKNPGKINFPDTKCKVKPPLKSLRGGSRKLPTVEHHSSPSEGALGPFCHIASKTTVICFKELFKPHGFDTCVV